MNCPKCGNEVLETQMHCHQCGTVINPSYTNKQMHEPSHAQVVSSAGEAPARVCQNCGTRVDADARFCKNCARPLNSADSGTGFSRKAVVIGAVIAVAVAIVIGIAILLSSKNSSGVTSSPSAPSMNPEQARRNEAIRFCQLLNQKQPELNRLNRQESSVVAEMGSWAGQIAFLGGGGQQKSNEAKSFSQRTKNIRQQLGQIRKVLESETLNVAYNQTARSNIISSLNQRERFLGEVIEVLDQSAAGLLRVDSFSYPPSIQKLLAQLKTYSQAQDNITPAVKEIRTKFDVTDSEMTR